MNIHSNNTVIRDHYLLMNAEGKCEKKPEEKDIIDYLKSKRWKCKDIKIGYNNFEDNWTWYCKIY